MSPSPVPSAGLAAQVPDALLAVIVLHRVDAWPGKIDVGVGVCRDPCHQCGGSMTAVRCPISKEPKP